MSNPEKSIQLLPGAGLAEQKFTENLARWVVDVGRVVIIATEIIAFVVFAYRIKLDRDLKDISRTLSDRLTVAEGAKDIEEKTADAQERLFRIKSLRERQKSAGRVISFAVKNFSPDVDITGLTYDYPHNTSVSAKTNRALYFSQAVTKLKSGGEVEQITMTAGKFDAKDGLYHFSLVLELKGGFFNK